MKDGFRQLDRIIRGDATKMRALQGGQLELSVGKASLALLLLAAFAGLCTGSFGVLRDGLSGTPQMVSSAVKIPLVFFLSILVTFPSLYVFNALAGSRLTISAILKLMIVMLSVMITLLASLGPIIFFFGLSTTSYPFMKVLNVVAGLIAGGFGLAFLRRTLHRLVVAHQEHEAQVEAASERMEDPSAGALSEAQEAGSEPKPWPRPGPAPKAEARDDRARLVFRIWLMVFALVGAQMSWVLRPFIGAPGSPFTIFRAQESNFFVGVLNALTALLF